MDKNTAFEKIGLTASGKARPAGGIATIYTQKTIPTTAGPVVKRSTFQIRGGLDYENTEQVKAVRAAGKPRDPSANAWLKRDNPWLGHHVTNSREYVVGQPLAPLNFRSVCQSSYYLNNVKLDSDQVAKLIPVRDREKKAGAWATIPLDTITDIR